MWWIKIFQEIPTLIRNWPVCRRSFGNISSKRANWLAALVVSLCGVCVVTRTGEWLDRRSLAARSKIDPVVKCVIFSGGDIGNESTRAFGRFICAPFRGRQPTSVVHGRWGRSAPVTSTSIIAAHTKPFTAPRACSLVGLLLTIRFFTRVLVNTGSTFSTSCQWQRRDGGSAYLGPGLYFLLFTFQFLLFSFYFTFLLFAFYFYFLSQVSINSNNSSTDGKKTATWNWNLQPEIESNECSRSKKLLE